MSGLPMPRYFENALLFLIGRICTPLPSLSNSSLSPLRTPSIRRTSRGTVICPLLVIVACFCLFTPFPYFITISLPYPVPAVVEHGLRRWNLRSWIFELKRQADRPISKEARRLHSSSRLPRIHPKCRNGPLRSGLTFRGARTAVRRKTKCAS